MSTEDIRRLPYLLPWVRVLFLIRSITSTEWNDLTGRFVQPILRRALEMRRRCARDGWWNWTLGAAGLISLSLPERWIEAIREGRRT